MTFGKSIRWKIGIWRILFQYIDILMLLQLILHRRNHLIILLICLKYLLKILNRVVRTKLNRCGWPSQIVDNHSLYLIPKVGGARPHFRAAFWALAVTWRFIRLKKLIFADSYTFLGSQWLFLKLVIRFCCLMAIYDRFYILWSRY